MELDDFTGKPCRSKTAYEFLPKHKVKINLQTAEEELRETAKTEIASKVLLMVKIDNTIASIFPSGKILVRGEREETKAKEYAKRIVNALKKSVS